jgi:hypothetical protein
LREENSIRWRKKKEKHQSSNNCVFWHVPSG